MDKLRWLSRWFRKGRADSDRPSIRPCLEALEDRTVPTTFTVSNVNNTGAGSLRQAILDANASAGHDVIRFAVGANLGGPIRLTSSLPSITSPVTMDGSRLFIGTIELPNSSGRPQIEIDGSLAGNGTEGLHLDQGANGSFIRGLIINRFDDDGIAINASSITIQNCWIGLTNDGNGNAGNGAAGIRLIGSASSNLIGGPLVTQRNIISGQAVGIATGGGAGTKANNVISGNFIGTNVAGAAAIPNNFGIFLSNPATSTVIFNNLISGNTSYGIVLSGSTVTGTQIRKNKIGVQADGVAALGNGIFGILLCEGTHDNTIGGTNAFNDGNLVAFSGQINIVVGNDPSNITLNDPAGVGNRVLGNSLFLAPSAMAVGPPGTPIFNDPLDADTGPNNLQNFPTLTSALGGAASSTISIFGTLGSTPNRTYRVEFFIATGVVAGMNADLFFLDSTNVTTDSAGNATINFTSNHTVPAGQFLVPSATDLTTGDTSNLTSIVVTENTPPMIVGDALTPEILEGGLATLSGRLVDPDIGDLLTLRVNWGDHTPEQQFHPGLAPFAFDHRYEQDGTYDVHFIWEDSHGGSNSRTRTVVVRNGAPVLSGVQLSSPGSVRQPVALTGTIVDPGVRDRFTLVVTWGDGSEQIIRLGQNDRSFQLRHSYSSPGTYDVVLTVLDDFGDVGTATTTLILEA